MKQVLIALALCAGPAFAEGPDRVSILMGSVHVDAAIPFEEVNPGLFLTWEDRGLDLDYSLGAYRNSYGRVSIAATAALPLAQWDGGQFSVFAGVAYYPENGREFAVSLGDVVPVGGVQIRHENIFAQIIPSDGKLADAIVTCGLTFSLK
jgi:hypothetical protein